MVDYRKRLIDMSPEERRKVAPSSDNFSKVFGDRSEEPLSVTAADTAVSLATPVDSIVEVQKELKKEEPDYLKIGMLAGVEVLSSIPALGPAAKSMVRKGADLVKQTDASFKGATNIPAVSARANKEFKKTVKGYKLFTKGEDEKLYPLFVDADTEIPVGSYMKAVFPEYKFKAENGNTYVPSRGTKGKKGTGDSITIPDQETRDMLIKAGFLAKGSKAKTIKAVAARPGFHAGDNPTAAHIGPEIKIDGKNYKIRGGDQVWAEIEMPADVDWQEIANNRATLKKDGTPNVKTAHITDELPLGGYYRYKTNPNMQGNWLISGDMKVNRVLDRDEVKKLNLEAGVEDLPTESELREKLGKDFAYGGLVGDSMYQGVDDYQMSEMGAEMNKGGPVEDQMKTVFKSSRGYAEGGIAETVDPVSGNDVPPGSLPAEVRDDVPAQLSEGEYVVPADVVRYFGVKAFEDMRMEAKQGMSQMDAEGRIGGDTMQEEALPFSDDELMTVDISEDDTMAAMNEGGMVYAQEGTMIDSNLPDYGFSLDPNDPTKVVSGLLGGLSGSGYEYKTYFNKSGQSVVIPFFNGVEQAMIPEGYSPDAPKKEVVDSVKSDNDDPTPINRLGEGVIQREDYLSMNKEELEDAAKQANAINKLTRVGSGLIGGLPAMALLGSQSKAAYNNIIEAQKQNGYITSEQYDSSRQGSIFGGESGLYSNLMNVVDDDGNVIDTPSGQGTFGDTWLGDLLGFDGAVGVAGPGLRESIGGARRNQSSTSSNSGSSNSASSNSGSSPKVEDTSDGGYQPEEDRAPDADPTYGYVKGGLVKRPKKKSK